MERPTERRRLPPLNALRAFEAAARHMNFSRAAEELSVTPGAVSQQIQNLEDYVGAALFKRTPKGLLLTDAAQTPFAAKWRLPRLGYFEAKHPEVDVWLPAGMELVDFASGEVDVAIRY